MTSTEILQILTTIFHQIFDDDSIVLTPETTAADVGEWDSVNHLNLIIAVEVRFGIKFAVAETEELRNVGQLVKLIQAKVEARKK